MSDREMKIEVLVYPDGGTQVSVPPVERLQLARLLDTAAAALQRAAETSNRDLEPIACRRCGAVPQQVTASLDGTTTLLPCGHATDAGAA